MEMTTRKQMTMTKLIASNGAKELARNLHLSDEQIMKANSAALALSSNPALAKCDNFSKLKYCYEISRFNFSRDDCMYPVAYGNSIQAQIGYKGFKELALRSGEYEDIKTRKVHECDHIEIDEDTGDIYVKFEKDYNKSRMSKTIGYYAFAIGKNGKITNTIFWTKEDCEKHGKTYSKTYNSLWGKNEYSFDKMAMKTVTKQLTNELKTTPLLEQAKKLDGYVYGAGYADNPQNHKVVKSEVDTIFDNTINEDTGEVVENINPTPEEIAMADIKAQIVDKNDNI